MAISFKWSITKLKVTPELVGKINVVVSADWFVQAIDDANQMSAAAAGNCEFVLGDSFTDYNQLTEEQVLNWCFEPKTFTLVDPVNGVKKEVITHFKEDNEAQVAKKIELQLTKKQVEPDLPWKI
jgi:hypothetical protein